VNRCEWKRVDSSH